MKSKLCLMKVATGIIGGFGVFLLILLFTFTTGEAASGGPDEFSLLVSQLVQDEWDDSFFDTISLRIGDEYMYVDGEPQRIGGRNDVPILVQGEAMLPIMEIADFAGAYVDFDMREQLLTIETDDAYIEMFIGEAVAYVDGEPEDLSAAPILRNGIVMLAIDDSAFALGFDEPIWTPETQEIILTNTYQTRRLIVQANGRPLPYIFEGVRVIRGPDFLYILQFDSVSAAREASYNLNNSPNVLFSEPDIVATLENMSWGTARISADRYTEFLYTLPSRREVVVAVVDSGVYANHSFLRGRVMGNGWNFIYHNRNTTDRNGHGTHVAGTIVDATPSNVRIMPISVFDARGHGLTLAILNNAIRFAVDNGAHVINMSLSGPMGGSTRMASFEAAAAHARSRGVVLVAAAGNQNIDARNRWPAYYSGVITVAAIDNRDARASFSNFGPAVDVAAPGVAVRSPIHGNRYASKNGTSMASPHVAAAAALLLTNDRNLTPVGVANLLRNNADRRTPTSHFGSGIVNLQRLVPAITVTSVSLNRSTMTLVEGDTGTLTATVLPTNAANRSVSWTSSNTNVATVSTAGVVTARRPGTTTITARTTCGGRTATCTVTVTAANVAVTSVSLNRSSLRLYEGDVGFLTATVSPTNATNRNVTWSSSNTNVAIVESTGEVWGVRPGTATITARTVDGGRTASATVNVISTYVPNVPVTGVSLSRSEVTLREETMTWVFETVSPQNATNRNVTWSSSNPSVAAVIDGVGGIEAFAPGTATITVRTVDGGFTASVTVTVTATNIPVSSVSLNRTRLYLSPGDTETLIATVSPANATNRNVTWEVDDPRVATVSASGVVTAVGQGITTITARADGRRATARVEVSAPNTFTFDLSVMSYSRRGVPGDPNHIGILGSIFLNVDFLAPTWSGEVDLFKNGVLYRQGRIEWDGSINTRFGSLRSHPSLWSINGSIQSRGEFELRASLTARGHDNSIIHRETLTIPITVTNDGVTVR